MSMRLRGASASDLEKLGIDTEGMTDGKKSIVKQYKAMAGIDIMEGTDYKSTFRILDELHDKWADLNDAERAAITEATGGKRGGSVMSSLMENWEDAKKAYKTAEESQHSAEKENEAYMNSVEAHYQQLQASLQELANTLISTDVLKEGIDLLKELVNIISEIPPIVSLISAGGFIAFINRLGNGGFAGLADDAKMFSNAFSLVGDAITEIIKKDKDVIDFTETISDIPDSIKDMNDFMSDGVEDFTDEFTDGLKDVIETEGSTTSATAKLGSTLKGAFTGLAITAAITAFIYVLGKLITAEEEAAKRTRELTDSFNEDKSNIDNYKQRIIDIQEALADDSISYEEAKTKREELYSIQSELIEQYGTEAENIDIVTDAINGQVDALDKLGQKKYIEYLNNLNDVSPWEQIMGFISGSGTGSDKIEKMFSDSADYYSKLSTPNNNVKTVLDTYLSKQKDDLDEIYKLYDAILKKQKEYDKDSADYKILGLAASQVKKDIDAYGGSNKLKIEYELIPDDKNLSDYDSQLKTLYDKYKDVRIKDGEEAAEIYKKQLITVFNDIQSDSSVSDNVKDYWSDVYAEIIPSANEQRFKDDFDHALNTLYEDIEVPVEDTDVPVEPKFYVKDPEEQKEKLKEELEKLSEGGNVDLTARTKISTSMLKDAGYEDVGDGYATTYTQTFSSEDETMAINVTPIFTNPETGQTEVLTEDELIDYTESLLRGDINDYLNLQIGATFTGEDAIAQAEQAAKYSHEVQEQYYSDNPLEVDAAIKFEDADAQEYYNLLKKYEDRLNQKGHVFGDNIIYNPASEKDSIKDYQRIMQLEKELAAKGYTGDEFVLPSMQKIGSNETQIKRQVTTVQDKIKEIIKQSGFNFWEDLLASGENNNYYKQIQDILDKYELAIEDVIPSIADKIGLKSKTSYETDKNLAQSVERFKNKAAGVTDEDQSRDYKDLIALTSTLTEEQRHMFVQVTAGAKSALEAMDMWKESLNGVEDKVEELSDTDFISNINTNLSDLDKIKSIYDDVKDKGDFDYTATTDDDFKEKFAQYEKEYEDFVTTVTKNPDDIKATQDAFDNLVDAWVRGSGVLDGLTEDNKQYAIKELTDNGIVNAEEVVNKYLEQQNAAAKYKEELKELAPELAKYKNNLAALAGKKASGGKSENVLSTKEVKEYNKEIKKTQGYLTKLTGVDISKELTEEFAKSATNLDDLQAALEGSETAIERVKTAIGTGMILEIDADIDTDHANEVIGSFVSYVNSIDPELIGTADFNTAPAVQALNMLLAQTGATASRIEAIYGSLGVDATVTGFKKIRVPDLSTKREEINNGITSYRYDYKEVSFPTIEYKKKGGGNLGSHYASPTKNTGSGGSGGGDGGGGGGSSKSDPTKTSFDWIERRIKKLTDVIDDFNKKVSNTWLSWKTRNTELGKSIKENEKLLKSYTKSEKSYQRAMNNIAKGKNAEGGNNKEWDNYTGKKASKKQKAKWEKYTKWIKEGRITMSKEGDLKLITDKEGEDFAGQLQAWQDYWDKKVEAEKNAYDTMLTIQEQYEERSSMIQEHYNSLREMRESKLSKDTAKYDRLNLLGIPTEKEISNYYSKVKAADEKILQYDKSEAEKLQKELDAKDASYDKKIEKAKKAKDKKKALADEASKKAKTTKKKKGKNSEAYKKAKEEADAANQAYKDANKEYKKIKKEQTKEKKEWLKSDARYDAKTAINEANAKVVEDETKLLYQNYLDEFQAFVDRINKIYDNATRLPAHNLELADAYASQLEASGKVLSEAYYSFRGQQITDQLKAKKEQKASLDKALKEMFDKGWTLENDQVAEVWNERLQTETEIYNLETDMLTNESNMKQVQIEINNLVKERIDDLKQETNLIRSVLSIQGELFDTGVGNNDIGTGRFTDIGLATLGTYVTDYGVDYEKLQKAKKALEDYKKTATDGSLLDDNVVRQLTKDVNDATLAFENDKKAIVDIYKQMYQEILKEFQKVINKRKESLQLQKNEYDYNKKIRNQTRDVNILRKQLSAMAGDETEENRARIQKLQVQLKDAEETLEESEYDKWVSDTNEMLDDLYEEFSDLYTTLGRNIEDRVKEGIDTVNTNSNTIKATIKDNLELAGTTLSETMRQVFSTSAITSYFDGTNPTSVFTTTKAVIDAINTKVQSFVQYDYSKLIEAAKTNETTENNNSGSYGSNTSTDKTESYTRTEHIALIGGSGSNQPKETPKKVETKKETAKETAKDSNATWFKKIFGKTPKKQSGKKNSDTSIVDKLAYWGVDSSKSSRTKYWKALGYSGTYSGTAAQNTKMLNALKSHGYATGGSVAGTFRQATGEDGIALVRKGEYILTPEMLKDALAIVNPLAELSNSLGSAKADNLKTKIEMGDVNFSVTLPNVKNYDEFKSSLIADKQFEKVIQEVSIGRSLGNNSLKKYSIR